MRIGRGGLHFDLLLGIGLRGLGAVSSFAFVWMIARRFGPHDLGLYQLAFATATTLSLVCVMGLDTLLVREIGRMLRSASLGEARAWFQAARRHVLILGVVASIGLAVLAWPLSRVAFREDELTVYLLAMAPAVALLAQMRVNNWFLRTNGLKWLSQLLEGVSYTTLATVALGVLWLLAAPMDGVILPILFVTALASTVLVSIRSASRIVANWPAGQTAVLDKSAGVTVAAGPITSQGRDWLVLLLITTQLGASDAGIYRVAFQYCMLFQLVNTSFEVMAGPHLSRMAAGGEYRQMQRAVVSAGLLGLALCLPLGLLIAFAADWLVGLFGPQFVKGALALQFLAIGQLVNVAFGPVGSSLVMLHRERTVLMVEVVASIVGLALGLALFGRLGIAGMALGMTATAIVSNAANALFLRRALAQRAAAGDAEPAHA